VVDVLGGQEDKKAALAGIAAVWLDPDEEMLQALPMGAGNVDGATTRTFTKSCHGQ
jgi:hypothetical protein